MSFILEALKRAERSRRPGQQREAFYRDAAPLPETRRQRFWPWLWVGCALLANALVLALVLRPKIEPPERLRPAPATLAELAPAGPAAPALPAATSAPLQAVAAREVPAAASAEARPAPAAPAPRRLEPAAAPFGLHPPPGQPLGPRPGSIQGASGGQAALVPSPEPALAPPLREPPLRGAAAPVVPALPTRDPVASTPGASPVAAPTRQADRSALPEPRASASDELSPEERQALPRLELSAHVYADDPAHRMVFINGQSYRTGQRIGGGGGPLVKEITPEGVVVDYGNGVVRLRAEH